MIDPAFSQLRVTQAFGGMQAAVAAYIEKLAHQAEAGTPFSLDFAMSELTADVICRTIFSTSLASETAQKVFSAFAIFERSAAHIELPRLIFSKAFSAIPQHDAVLAATKISARSSGPWWMRASHSRRINGPTTSPALLCAGKTRKTARALRERS